jgi:hypothetical protein
LVGKRGHAFIVVLGKKIERAASNAASGLYRIKP